MIPAPQSSGILLIIQTINLDGVASPASVAIWHLFSIYVFWPRTKQSGALSFLDIVLFGHRPFWALSFLGSGRMGKRT